MARIRTIKPEFWTDEKLTECSLSARLLFIGTWNFADDYGNLDRSPKQMKARIFPLDNIDCEPLIQELMTQGLMVEYAYEGRKYLHIQGFTKHQLINRPSKPQCPIHEHSVSAQEPLTLEGKEGKDIRPRSSESYDDFPEFVAFWDKYFRKDDKKKAFQAWKKAKPPFDLVMQALEWQSPQYLSREVQYRPLAATYINGARWEDQKTSTQSRPTQVVL
jgi:hypothetical protein